MSPLKLAWAQTTPPKEIEYAYPDQSVWTTKLDAKGEPANPLLNLADVLFAKAGIPWRAKSYPAARLFGYLKNGTVEFSILVKAPALQDCCLFSQKPVVSTELRVFHQDGKPAIRSREDLAGKSVITILGYSYAGWLDFIADPKNGVAHETAATHDAAFAMLEHGRADYVLDYAGPAAEVQAARKTKFRHAALSRLDVHLVLVKSYPGALATMQRLEAALEGLNIDDILQLPKS
jgi:polar amino acid transport system substrate-binding protein